MLRAFTCTSEYEVYVINFSNLNILKEVVVIMTFS